MRTYSLGLPSLLDFKSKRIVGIPYNGFIHKHDLCCASKAQNRIKYKWLFIQKEPKDIDSGMASSSWFFPEIDSYIFQFKLERSLENWKMDSYFIFSALI